MLFLALASLAADEATLYYVEDFEAGGCGDTDDALEWSGVEANNMAVVLAYWIGLSVWDDFVTWADDSVEAGMFTDPSMESWGIDDVAGEGADGAPIAFVSTHGRSWCNQNGDKKVGFTSGSPAEQSSCVTDVRQYGYGGIEDEILVGHTGLYNLITSACETAQKCAYDAGVMRQGGLDNGSALFVWTGHHGYAWDTAGQAAAVGDFASASRVDGLGVHWVEERHVDQSGADSDHCPAVVVRGSSQNKRNEIYYDAGFTDRIDGGATSTGTTYYYVVGCDPADASALP